MASVRHENVELNGLENPAINTNHLWILIGLRVLHNYAWFHAFIIDRIYELGQGSPIRMTFHLIFWQPNTQMQGEFSEHIHVVYRNLSSTAFQ